MFPRPPRAVDILLADVVRKIQLSPTDYDLAVARYKAIAEWLEREGSPLRGLVVRLYPQGSMAMRTTISSRLENDEFDIDIMAELNGVLYRRGARWILDTLFDALNGEQGSRYHGKVTRNTRCVTVAYADMHLDVTPAFLLNGEPRTSRICHSKLELPPSQDRYVTANPWGFAQWFTSALPAPAMSAMDMMTKAAETEPVPERPELHERSFTLMALQLLKRWRNKRYDQRTGRWPPSIMLACLVGEHAGLCSQTGAYRLSLHDELSAQAGAMLATFENLDARGALIHRSNPRCPQDVITDRWPGDMLDQATFLRDLRDLDSKLRLLGRETTIAQKRTILADLFGERVTRLAFETYQERLDTEARGPGLLYSPVTGAMLSGVTTVLPGPARGSGTLAPRHTTFGGIPGPRPWRS